MNREDSIIVDENIINRIYYIRTYKVILDSDLAFLYGVETKVLKQAVKRNIDRFPKDFMFELTKQENEIIKIQLGPVKRGSYSKYLPYAFTELGVAMISSVLNSKKAIAVNIQIMRIFTQIKKQLLDVTELKFAIEKLERKSDNHSKNIELIFKYLDELLENKENTKPRKPIGYKLTKTRKP